MPIALDHGPHRAPRRFLVAVLLLYTAFVAYGSLVPLALQPLAWDEAWQRFAALPFGALRMPSRTDWAVNFLLLVPMAFLGQAVLAPPPANPGRQAIAAAAVALVCAAFAFAIEFVQVYFPGRTMSAHDIQAQILGSWLGLALQARWGGPVAAWLAGWWQAEQGRALTTRLLHGYLVGLLLFAVMPLDLTISPVELFHKWRDGRVALLPFTDLPSAPVQAVYELGIDLLLWAPAGLLWAWGGATVPRVMLRGLVVAGLIEALQLFVFSRHSSSSDLITGALGCGLGALLATRLGRPLAVPAPGAAAARPAGDSAAGATGIAGRRWLTLWLAWAALTLAAFWYPFDFSTGAAQLDAGLAGLARLPFQSYFESTELRALNEILRKLLMFLPGGLLWSLHLLALPPWRRPAQCWLGRLALLALALAVEGGQLLLPGKVADLTDLALEAAGAWIGLSLGLRLFALPMTAAPGAPPAKAAASSAAGSQAMAAATATPALPATPARLPAPGRDLPAWADAAAVLLLALLLGLVGRSPATPYNVRELFLPGASAWLTALALALACWWLFALPLWLLRWWRARPERALWLVPGLPLLGLVGVLPLLAAVPGESLDDIVGSPVLGWPAPLEQVLRYAALHGALALALLGATWGVARLAWPRSHELMGRWLVLLVSWAVPLHAVVVSAAATDNLTELMRGGGGPMASACLFGGALLLFGAAAAAGAASVARRRRGLLIALVPLGLMLAAGLLWLGSEPMLVKYERTFSAAQFLLSSDRQHYAGGAALALRFAVAELGLLLLVGLMQGPGWWRLAHQVRAARGAGGRATLRASPTAAAR